MADPVPKLLFVVTEDWYFWSHRLALARAARSRGIDVTVASRVDAHGDRIRAEGFALEPLSLDRRSSPLRWTFALARLYRRLRPDIVHHIALKPALYGTLPARAAGAASVNTIAGLGSLRTGETRSARVLARCIGAAARVLFSGATTRVIVQNPEDQELLLARGRVPRERVTLVPGSGVDTTAFAPSQEPPEPLVVTMVSRMLWDKGVGELVEAARLLRAAGSSVRVQMAGAPDAMSMSGSVSEEQLRGWHDDGVITWLGHRDDVAAVWAGSHVAVLPSYGEGLPKSLLEAAACGRPIIATDVPGCRSICRDGVNGIRVPPRDADALVRAIERLAASPAERAAFGQRGREIVEREFAESAIVDQTLAVYAELLD